MSLGNETGPEPRLRCGNCGELYDAGSCCERCDEREYRVDVSFGWTTEVVSFLFACKCDGSDFNERLAEAMDEAMPELGERDREDMRIDVKGGAK